MSTNGSNHTKYVNLFFFFSSRRRHTRFDCDWSSDVCSSDLALAAAILKTVNSAYYGLPEKMSSLHHAILYLGFNNVYQLILENSIKNIMPQDEIGRASCRERV